jgi:hypothetical protein
MLADDLAIRAERLRVVLDLACGLPTLDVAQVASYATPMSPEIAASVNAEDLALASAVLTVEHELREEGWEALERLGAAVAGTHGELDVRVLALGNAEFVNAASVLITLGWVDY